jgi:hypothetical protein
MWNDIKGMESTTSGTLGTTTNLDCHMTKNSEWGAALLLTISAYGVGSANAVTNTSSSSTGNASGVYQLTSGWQWTAAYYTGGNAVGSNFLKTLDSKYVDKYDATSLIDYNSNYSASKIKGDALFAKGFLGSTSASWPGSGNPVFVRGGSGWFGFSSNSGTSSYGGRAVVVCGADF